MTARRIMGTETEYGIYQPGNPWANAVALSSRAVSAYARVSRASTPAWAKSGNGGVPAVRWDYTGEDPLNDLRGHRMDRAAADPSLLTDDPYHLAPEGGVERFARPSEDEVALPAPTTAVLTNGARLYVDHAHPEYSSPESSNPRDAVLWDRAGDVIARRMMKEMTKEEGPDVVLVKNNTDGKGAAYGSHENYMVERSVDLDDLIRGLTPFMISRPILCGAGRVGLGQKSEVPGFQMSQRADFVENEVGLETTFNRPIINTRDEPHANPAKHRRLHVIGGDANLFDCSTYLRLGTTSLVLWAIEQGIGLEWDALLVSDPVRETWMISHNPDLTYRFSLAGGRMVNAVDLQEMYLTFVLATYERLGITPSEDDREVLDLWQSVLDRMREDLWSVAEEVEWVAKYQLLRRMKERSNLEWSDPRLAALDLQWSDLRADRGLAARLDAAGRIHRLFNVQQVERAADEPPSDTRAAVRGNAVRKLPTLVRASWTSLIVDDAVRKELVRVPLAEPDVVDEELLSSIERGYLGRE